MARQFKISDPAFVSWLFVDSYAGSLRYISYRHVIEHALFVLVKNKISLTDIKNDFIEFKKKFDNGEDITSQKIDIKIYFFKADNRAALVDGTEWCFPLICYVEGRTEGLKMAVNNIHEKLDPILDVLEHYHDKDWNQELQNKMNDFDSRKRDSNDPKMAA